MKLTFKLESDDSSETTEHVYDLSNEGVNNNITRLFEGFLVAIRYTNEQDEDYQEDLESLSEETHIQILKGLEQAKQGNTRPIDLDDINSDNVVETLKAHAKLLEYYDRMRNSF